MYLRLRDLNKAEYLFKQVLPIIPLGYLNLALLELQRNSISASYNYVNQFIEQGGDIYDKNIVDIGHCFLAQLYLLKGQFIHVERELSYVTSTELHGSVNLILGLLSLPDKMKAFSYFDKGAKHGDGYCSYAAAACLIQSRQYHEAKSFLTAALPRSSKLNSLAVLGKITKPSNTLKYFQILSMVSRKKPRQSLTKLIKKAAH